MKYQENLPPEGINTSKQHPLKELTLLLGGALAILSLLMISLQLSAGWLAKQISFEREQAWFADLDVPRSAPPSALLNYLEQRVAALLPAFNPPPGLKIQIQVSSSDELNAYAAPGSHIVLHKGLLAKLPNENALSMLIAHEMAHVIHRDALVTLSQHAAGSIAFALVFGSVDNTGLQSVHQLALLGFSREMESQADRSALIALAKTYGHTAGSDALFKTLMHNQDGIAAALPAFLSTHPSSPTRIKDLKALAKQLQTEQQIPTDGELTPLPQQFPQWLDELSDDPAGL